MKTRMPALRLNYRFTLSSGERVFDIATLRRPGLVLRFTQASNISVDESLLSRSFPSVVDASRLVALVVLAGTLEVEQVGLVSSGESILVPLSFLGRARSKSATHLNLEWDAGEPAGPTTPRRLGPPPMDRVRKIADALLDRSSDQMTTFASAFEIFRGIGAPTTLSVDAFEGEPTERHRKYAEAIEAQLADLSSHTHTMVNMGESLNLSGRHVQRGFVEFCDQYGLTARSWRDLRNRWRVENAALLLSRPKLTVADVAREVGYASPNALARAFAQAGLPSPAVLRQRMSEMDPLC